jgi:D-glycero-D-manno-heptose 1,7-bisphosphate phosphatase
MSKAVFLDRDGVVNRSNLMRGVPVPPRSILEVEVLEGVVEGINLLKSHNFLPVVITNQPDVARGIVTREQVEEINTHIGVKTGIEYFYTCYHDDMDKCPCRKPAPGLIHLASSELDINLDKSFVVGDRWRDISAGQAAGCKTFFIDYSYSEKRPDAPFIIVSSLLEAANLVTGVSNETN